MMKPSVGWLASFLCLPFGVSIFRLFLCPHSFRMHISSVDVHQPTTSCDIGRSYLGGRAWTHLVRKQTLVHLTESACSEVLLAKEQAMKSFTKKMDEERAAWTTRCAIRAAWTVRCAAFVASRLEAIATEVDTSKGLVASLGFSMQTLQDWTTWKANTPCATPVSHCMCAAHLGGGLIPSKPTR